MLLRYPLHGRRGPLGLACRLGVQNLASVRLVRQTLVLRLGEVLHPGEVLRRQVLVRLVLVHLVLVLRRRVLVRLDVVVPCLGLKRRDCYLVEPWGEVCPCLGSKKMDCYPGEVRLAS